MIITSPLLLVIFKFLPLPPTRAQCGPSNLETQMIYISPTLPADLYFIYRPSPAHPVRNQSIILWLLHSYSLQLIKLTRWFGVRVQLMNRHHIYWRPFNFCRDRLNSQRQLVLFCLLGPLPLTPPRRVPPSAGFGNVFGVHPRGRVRDTGLYTNELDFGLAAHLGNSACEEGVTPYPCMNKRSELLKRCSLILIQSPVKLLNVTLRSGTPIGN